MATLLLAFGIGVVAGMRTMMAPAVVSVAVYLGWLDLGATPLAFLGSPAAAGMLALLALGELIVDKLPSTPSRLLPGPLGARVVSGLLTGAALAVASHISLPLGASVGAAGALAGAFACHRLRVTLPAALGLPDFIIALFEDAAAIGTAWLIVSVVYTISR